MKLAIPEIKQGEKYLGAITEPDGRTRHTIVLPGDHDNANWDDSMEWAKSIGGDLPDRIEQAMMLAFMHEEFKREAYWSNTLHTEDSGYAWFQKFRYGGQNDIDRSGRCRARAVRRVAI